MTKKKIVVLIPALNPNADLIDYIKELATAKKNIDVIVVNDGSKKELDYIFEELAKIKSCIVLKHAINLGKGRALKTGFNYFLNNYTEKETLGIITADSDGQHAIKDIIEIGEQLNTANQECLILGTRDFNEEHVPFKSRKGNKITTFIFKLLYGKKINDTQTGLRGLTYSFVKDCLSLDGERFEYEINMLIEAVRKNISIVEHTIETIYFDNNSETHFNPIKDSIKIYKVMFGKFFKYILSSLASAIIDILLFTLIFTLSYHNINKEISIVLSTILARIFSSLFNYTVNKNVVFNDAKGKITIIKYYILCFFQTIMSWALVNSTFLIAHEHIHPSIIKIVVDTILFLISFQIQQHWVFRKEKK